MIKVILKGWQGLKGFKNNLGKQVNSDNMKVFAQCGFHFYQGQHCLITSFKNQQNTIGSYFNFSRRKHWQILDKEEKFCSIYNIFRISGTPKPQNKRVW